MGAQNIHRVQQEQQRRRAVGTQKRPGHPHCDSSKSSEAGLQKKERCRGECASASRKLWRSGDCRASTSLLALPEAQSWELLKDGEERHLEEEACKVRPLLLLHVAAESGKEKHHMQLRPLLRLPQEHRQGDSDLRRVGSSTKARSTDLKRGTIWSG